MLISKKRTKTVTCSNASQLITLIKFLKPLWLPRYDEKKSIILKIFSSPESATLCEKKCPPHHFLNSHGYQDTTI